MAPRKSSTKLNQSTAVPRASSRKANPTKPHKTNTAKQTKTTKIAKPAKRSTELKDEQVKVTLSSISTSTEPTWSDAHWCNSHLAGIANDDSLTPLELVEEIANVATRCNSIVPSLSTPQLMIDALTRYGNHQVAVGYHLKQSILRQMEENKRLDDIIDSNKKQSLDLCDELRGSLSRIAVASGLTAEDVLELKTDEDLADRIVLRIRDLSSVTEDISAIVSRDISLVDDCATTEDETADEDGYGSEEGECRPPQVAPHPIVPLFSNVRVCLSNALTDESAEQFCKVLSMIAEHGGEFTTDANDATVVICGSLSDITTEVCIARILGLPVVPLEIIDTYNPSNLFARCETFKLSPIFFGIKLFFKFVLPDEIAIALSDPRSHCCVLTNPKFECVCSSFKNADEFLDFFKELDVDDQ